MPSPFPGMDPYLESRSHWCHFHTNMIVNMGKLLNRDLPDRYIALVEENVWLEPQGDGSRTLFTPDVSVADLSSRSSFGSAPGIQTAPATVTFALAEIESNHYLRIIDRDDNEIVTIVELLSPSNKKNGEGREEYIAKRNKILRGGKSNLVEIDLLRTGQRPSLGNKQVKSQYYALICRIGEFPQAGIWTFTIRDHLPMIPVPLRASEPSVSFSLQECFNRTYEETPFRKIVDYSNPPHPPLDNGDTLWAHELLHEKKI